MNKCRRQVTLTAQALGRHGVAALSVDLSGTGDSDGEFRDASWGAWKSDVIATIDWAESRGLSVDGLVATRLGAALAAEALGDAGRSVGRTVFWQPVANGQQHMTQFLRLRIAASLMGDQRETHAELRARLEAGDVLEVAGYALADPLVSSIERVDLGQILHKGLGALLIAEVGRSDEAVLSAVGRRLLASSQSILDDAEGQRVSGEPFWTSTEIVVNPDLCALTADYFAPRDAHRA